MRTGKKRVWQIAGFSSEEAKKWKEFEPDYAKEWKEQGFSPADAEEWFKGGFDFKGGVLAAKKWKEFGLSLKTGYAAEILSLDVNDIPVDSVLLLPKNKSLKDIPPEIIGLLSVCKANKLNFHNHLNSMKAFIEEECSNQFEKYHSDIFKRNPYEIVGKCFGIDGKIFQLLDKSTGLFKVKFKSSQLVFLDFKNKYAPVMDFSAFIKGVDPLQYKALLGSHKIVPSFEVHWFVKISPDLNFS